MKKNDNSSGILDGQREFSEYPVLPYLLSLDELCCNVLKYVKNLCVFGKHKVKPSLLQKTV